MSWERIAEHAVVAGRTTWGHLKIHDGWERPQGVTDEQAFLMVQIMETWFLADRDMLRRSFGPSLRETALHAWPQLEDVPKKTVLDALQQATRGCSQPYSKGKTSYELLRELNPERVEAACPHARALLDRLRGL